MRRNLLNLAIDAVTLLSMLGLAWTGLLLRYVLPPGSGGRGGGGLTLWGAGRHDWGEWHFRLAVLLFVLLAVHVALHWTWVCGVVARWRSSGTGHPVPGRAARYVAGAALLAAAGGLLALPTWYAGTQVVETAREGRGGSSGGGHQYRGGRGEAGAAVTADGTNGEGSVGVRRGGGGRGAGRSSGDAWHDGHDGGQE